MDAEQLDLPDGSVDGVICRWGYMLMAHPAVAFRETRRVLRPGGHLCFSVFASAERNPWAAIPARVLIEGGHMVPPAPESPGILALANPDRIKRLLSDAGFGLPRIEEVPIVWSSESPDQYWSLLREVAGALAAVITGLPEDRQDSVRQTLQDRLASFRRNGGYAIPGVCLNVVTSSAHPRCGFEKEFLEVVRGGGREGGIPAGYPRSGECRKARLWGLGSPGVGPSRQSRPREP